MAEAATGNRVVSLRVARCFPHRTRQCLPELVKIMSFPLRQCTINAYTRTHTRLIFLGAELRSRRCHAYVAYRGR